MIKYVSLHGKQLLLSTVRDSLSWLLMLITGIGALIAFFRPCMCVSTRSGFAGVHTFRIVTQYHSPSNP